MAITASSTATGLLRMSLLVAYCITVVSLFFVTRHFQRQKSLLALKDPRTVNVSDLDHVANRGIGKWAKVRRGNYISNAVETDKKNAQETKESLFKEGIVKSARILEADKKSENAKQSQDREDKKDQKKRTSQKSNDDNKEVNKKKQTSLKFDEEEDDDEEEFKRNKPQPQKNPAKDPKPAVSQKTTPIAKPAVTFTTKAQVAKIKFDEEKDNDKEDFKRVQPQVQAVATKAPSKQPARIPASTTRTAVKLQATTPRPSGIQYAFGPPKGTIHPDRKKKLPDCLIIGVRKAGTRPLLHFLRFHPQVKGVGQELNFFSNTATYEKGLDWYLEQMPPVRPDKVLIEKSAEYFHSREAPKRVYMMNPDIKLILVVRDPFERMVSDYHFIQRYALFSNSSYPFEELTHTLEQLCINRTTGKVTGYSGLGRSKYAKHTEQWLRWFRREQLHIVDGEKFSNENPATELKKVEEFLRLEPFFNENFFFYNETKGYYCTKSAGCLSEEKGHSHPTFNPNFVHTIRAHLAPFNQRFYDLVGINFGWASTYT